MGYTRPGQDDLRLVPVVASPTQGPSAPPGNQSGSQTPAPSHPDASMEKNSADSGKSAEGQPEKQESSAPDRQFTQAERQLIAELKQTDTEVRNHEMAHVAAGGGLITSGASFTFQQGPDGKRYAVAGEVGIDTSPVPGDPQATLQKMRQVRTAALAPASPSSQDIKVASQASSLASKALADLTFARAKEMAAARETQAFGNLRQASGAYAKVNGLPENDTSTVKLAV